MSDTLDILTLPEGRDAINVKADNVEQDVRLARHITAISRLMDARCGPVVQRTITAELHHGSSGPLVLRNRPVVSITTVREAYGSSISTVTATTFGGSTPGYYADLRTGLVTRAGTAWPYGTNTVEVTYVAGRHATTAAVDARFKDCASSILRRLWKREAGAWTQSATFFEDSDDQITSGFFRVAVPIINEMLPADRQPAAFLGIA